MCVYGTVGGYRAPEPSFQQRRVHSRASTLFQILLQKVGPLPATRLLINPPPVPRSGKVPLVPRQPPPPTTSDDKTGGGGGGKKKDKGSTEDSVPIPPLEETAGLELDQQLVVHTFNTALTTLTSLVSFSNNTSVLHSIVRHFLWIGDCAKGLFNTLCAGLPPSEGSGLQYRGDQDSPPAGSSPSWAGNSQWSPDRGRQEDRREGRQGRQGQGREGRV